MAKKFENYNTPAGIAKFPFLNKPDTKFKAEGEFTCKLILSAEDAQPLIERIDAQLEAAWADYQEAETNAAKRKKMKRADPPYAAVVDETTGDETGDFEFRFKLPGQVTYKKGPKAGKTVKNTVKLFDARKKEIHPDSCQIGGGSTLKINYYFFPYNSPVVGVGVVLRLRAVQVLELVEFGAGGDYGFDEEEGGFEGDDSAPINRPAKSEFEDDTESNDGDDAADY